MDLAEFLNARLAEAENMARAAYAHHWAVKLTRDGPEVWVVNDDRYPEVAGLVEVEARWRPDETAAHIAAWDPAHVLAWCAAVRAVVEIHTGDHECPVKDPRPRTTYVHPDYVYANDPTLLPFARVWADHPDFDPAWRA